MTTANGDRARAPAPRRRLVVAAALAATVLAGLASRRWPLPGVLAEHAGDALYTVAAHAALCLLLPGLRPWTAAALAFAASALVECSQLLAWPWLAAARASPVGALLLGQGFQPADFVAYAAGAVLAGSVDVTFRRASPAVR